MPASKGRYRLPKESRKRGARGIRWKRWLVLLIAAGIGYLLWSHRWPSRGLTRGGTNSVTGEGGTAAPRRGSTNSLGGKPGRHDGSDAALTQRGRGLTEAWTARSITNFLEAQIALSGHGISGGSIDGAPGAQFSAALRAFQQQTGLEETGRLDRETVQNLRLEHPPFTTYAVTADDLQRLVHIPGTWRGKSELTAMDFESILELVAEHSHAHPDLVRRLNPNVDWNSVAPGTVLWVPDASYPEPTKAEHMRVSLAGRYLRAFGEHGRLLCHFPCSIGRIAEKRPIGGLHVAVVAKDPNYTMDPKVFPESTEAQALGRKLILPPGPNNPVGVVWLGLDRPGYGIHGTPGPEQVGRTESHGCFRLANWNAEYLGKMAWVGMPVSVEP